MPHESGTPNPKEVTEMPKTPNESAGALFEDKVAAIISGVLTAS